MSAAERALAGALSGFLATFVLSGLRLVLNRVGLVYATAPEQVVRRLEELGPVRNWSSRSQQALMMAAHFGYGTGAGTAFGVLRTEREEPESETAEEPRGEHQGPLSEAAVGATLGILSWGAGWAGWLPVAGVHPAPWTQRTPRALLPVLDHAFYGAAWGIVYWLLSRRHA